jgi:probable HAF family extracellular repeat protein
MNKFALTVRYICRIAFSLMLLMIAGLVHAGGVSGQGTWETTLQPRDLDGNGVTDAYYDTVLDITWLADADYMNTSGWTLGQGEGWPPFEFADYIAGFGHLGVINWRLPRTDSPNQGTTGGELEHMYAVTLGNVLAPNAGATLVNTGPFVNLQADCYLYESARAAFRDHKFFNMKAGIAQQQGWLCSGFQYARVWMVADGDAIPLQIEPPAYEIIDLGTLGGSYSYAYDINNSGQIVGYATNSSNVQRAFLYANGTMQDLGTLKANNSGSSVAQGINDQGQIVGVADSDSPVGQAGFLYTNLMTALSPLPVSSTDFEYIDKAGAINDNGDVAVTYWVRTAGATPSDTARLGVRAANGTLSLSPYLSYSPTASQLLVLGIDSAGSVLGRGPEPQASYGYYLLKNDQLFDVGYCSSDSPGAPCRPAYSINDNGEVASSYRWNDTYMCQTLFLECGPGFGDIESYGQFISLAADNSIITTRVPGSDRIDLISNSGEIVGVYNERYFVRPENGPNFYLEDVADASAWEWNNPRTYPFGIPAVRFYGSNDRGDFVGYAKTAAGQRHAVLVRKLPPAKTVVMDVDPYSTANEIRPNSDNPIAVAILTTSVAAGDAIDFDATTVDPTSLQLGLGKAPNRAYPWAVDVGNDGDTDVMFGFRTQDAGIFCGDTEVSLTGATFAGERIKATDTITTSDCVSTSCHP